MTPCKTCPHRPENRDVTYLVWGEIPTPGREVASLLEGPHACHYSLDAEECETLESWPCVGWPAAGRVVSETGEPYLPAGWAPVPAGESYTAEQMRALGFEVDPFED